MIEIKQEFSDVIEIHHINDSGVDIYQNGLPISVDKSTLPTLISRLIELGGVDESEEIICNMVSKICVDTTDQVISRNVLNRLVKKIITSNYHLIPKADKKEAE